MDSYQLYHTDSYLRGMEATVTLINGIWVALDQTVFYAQSGGQPADHSTLLWADAQTRVIDVRRRGNVLWHHIEGPIPTEGTRVHGLLDWERRYALMRVKMQRKEKTMHWDSDMAMCGHL